MVASKYCCAAVEGARGRSVKRTANVQSRRQCHDVAIKGVMSWGTLFLLEGFNLIMNICWTMQENCIVIGVLVSLCRIFPMLVQNCKYFICVSFNSWFTFPVDPGLE
jgi:hypothetical protein